jgi:hypothetical protein
MGTVKLKTAISDANLSSLRKSVETIPPFIRRDILRSRGKKDYVLKSCDLGGGINPYDIACAFRQILYCCGENGFSEVQYQRDKGIKVSTHGLKVLQDSLRS